MLVLSTRHKYKFKKQIQKIHWFSPDNRGGVVLLGLKTLGKDAIYHYGADSKLQFQHTFDDLIDSCAILDPKQVMVLEVKHNQIFILNLETHQIRFYKFHYFQIETSCQVAIETFIDTSLICIRQNGDMNDLRLKLTYYRYPFSQGYVKDPNQIVCTFQTTENYQWTADYSIRKGNNHSMIIWYKSRQDQVFQLRVFDLYNKQLKKGRLQGNFRILQIKNVFLVDQIPYKPAVCLLKVWEMKENSFMLICTTDKQIQKIYNKKGNVINNFVWNVDKEIIRDAQVQFDPQYNPFQIETLSSGRYAMFRTFYFQNNGEPIDSPALFIRNETQQVVGKQCGKVSSSSKWRVLSYSDSIFVQGIYDNSTVCEMELRIVKIVDKTLQSFHMLIQGDDDLDQQLLGQVINYLDYDQYP